ncbi:holo-ACP synthase [Helicobacter ailurogastricus]|uniref:Holo-[acyl-carrier-protein] synthase n=1 Tax=Helicobacter ailurogastricus TaxID=1578720 RepID=A0A0K2XY02_9HELI|nr:holo-ACP synthase [Helicobacter ailurogastricus]BDQ29126.1 holo-[acyl-carrier-protein] synthase [Helicobacter ailurogastricus]GLH57798.1 4'-phosphopantetheinyl transferase AcpS [Helicobacter ailurogastricus]GLH59222.1 4'-phosphopantetheinyl transferase AcpS [Helicobacter ailurogastricus]CRF52016.1 Holo-[acyl-carrier protein] synthase [Helicobacter ailurogastricus]
MIGLDIVAIERIAHNVCRYQDRFLNRFLSLQEQKLFTKPASLAGAWAAKEACSKALGVGIGARLGFLDIELSKSPLGAPLLNLNPAKQAAFKINSLHVSISHDGGFAAAIVFVQFNS